MVQAMIDYVWSARIDEAINQDIEQSNVDLDNEVKAIFRVIPDHYFCEIFKLDKALVHCLLVELHQKGYHHPINDMPSDIPFDKRVLATLSYLGNANYTYLQSLLYFCHYTPGQLNQCVKRTCKILVDTLSPEYIRFPHSAEERNNIKSEFLRLFSVPGVVGVLDCYYLHLKRVPPGKMEMYMSDNGMPSLAVQVICDHNYRFLDVNSRFSGGASKTRVWKSSHIQHMLHHAQTTEPNTWLIADLGYKLSPVVIHPYNPARTIKDLCFNAELQKIHKLAHQAFTQLQGCFVCLKDLPFNHEHADNIIRSCVTLHNFVLAKKGKSAGNISVRESNYDGMESNKENCMLAINRNTPTNIVVTESNDKKIETKAVTGCKRKGRDNRIYIKEFLHARKFTHNNTPQY